MYPEDEKDAERKALYLKIEEYTYQYYFSFDNDESLKSLYENLIVDLKQHMQLDEEILNPLPISDKWPTLIFRSLGLLSTLIGLTSLAVPLCCAVAVSSVIVAIYAVSKSFGSISRKEQGLKIQAALLAGKEYVFQLIRPNNPALLSPPEDFEPSFSQPSGSTLRASIGVASNILGLYGCFIGLIGAGLMIANPITLGVGIAVATFIAISFGVFTHRYKSLSSKAEKRLMLWAYDLKCRERQYLVNEFYQISAIT